MTTPQSDRHADRHNEPAWMHPLTSFQEPAPEEEEAGIVAHFAKGGEGWRATGTVARSSHGLVITRLVVVPGAWGEPVGASVTSRLLRDIPVGSILDEVRHWVATKEWITAADEQGVPGPVSMEFVTPSRTADQIIAASSPDKPSPGRAALPDELMQAVAEGYIAESAAGMPRGAVKRLAAALDRPEQTVSRWVVRARKEGWLGPGAAGREGAEPGIKLIAARATRRDDASSE
ncbi:hypothetical protein J7E87_19900 [Streptomyces sp. ISL-1]|uniref:hypothetical protein n=1 Tax=Streptomyces sp. ISL-1 TaxID=2817657 RepID=UPI001BEB95A6|nr:hypothetical protein [Streptomyces sp. ISL-1]MBT2391634.1 hypothetical protein [Streptomyces sp. ISL-1]